MTIRERILQYLDFKKITKYQFYKETGISNGFLDKVGAIGSDKCEIICSHYEDLSTDWLLLGNGSMIRQTINEPTTYGNMVAEPHVQYKNKTQTNESDRVKELQYTIDLQKDIIQGLKNKLLDRDASGAEVADAS